MNMLDRLDVVSLTTSSLILLCLASALILLARRRFEVALIVLLASCSIHWLAPPPDPMNTEELLGIGPTTYVRIVLVMLAGIAGSIVFMRSWTTSREKVPLYFKVLGLFILYALVSSSYSSDPRFTLVRSLELLAFLGFLLGLHTWIRKPDQADKVLLVSYAVLAVYIGLNALAWAVFPERAWSSYAAHRLQGLGEQPNSLGELCMITYPFALWMLGRASSIPGRTLALSVIGTALVMNVLSGSRASLVGAVICFVLWPLFKKKKLLAAAVMMAVIVLGTLLILNRPASFERDQGEGITGLTGREEFWRGSLVLIKEHPVMGYGYAVGGKVWEDARFRSGQVLWSGSARVPLHNGYLDTIIGLGIPGFALWMCFLVLLSVRAFLLPAGDLKSCVLVILLQSLFINMFESAFGGSRSIGSLVLMLTLVTAGKAYSLAASASPSDRALTSKRRGNEAIGSKVRVQALNTGT